MSRLVELPGNRLINPDEVESVHEIRTMPVRCSIRMKSGQRHEVEASYGHVKRLLTDTGGGDGS